MASAEETDSFDIFNLELELRAKLNELQWKSQSLEESQRELCETRRKLYQIETKLEDERRSSRQLELELKRALAAAKSLEEENAKIRTEEVRMRMKCDSFSMERNVLMNQARTARFENMDLKLKIQEYQRNSFKAKITNDTLEASLIELKNQVTRLHDNVDSNVQKLKEEQDQLKKSFEASINFAQRVQTIIDNCHAGRKQDQEEIQKLKQQLVLRDIPHQRSVELSVTNSCQKDTSIPSLHGKIESTLQELRSKVESNLIEEKLASICTELRKMDGNFGGDSSPKQRQKLLDKDTGSQGQRNLESGQEGRQI